MNDQQIAAEGKLNEEMQELGMRIAALRDACDVSPQEMADDLDIDLETYTAWETDGRDIPISAIYHIARKFDVDFSAILTGTSAKLQSHHIVRRGGGKIVDRHPGYHYEDMAWRYQNKIMQPLVVIIDPNDAPAERSTHTGQEFNFVIEGSLLITLGDKEFVLNEWDSIYFNPEIPHSQRCAGDKTTKFIAIIAE